MKNLVLFDTAESHKALLPLTFTRPASLLRCGILTISERWEKLTGYKPSYVVPDYLAMKYGAVLTGDDTFVAGCLLPTAEWADRVDALEPGRALRDADGHLIAYRGDIDGLNAVMAGGECETTVAEWDAADRLAEVPDIFKYNDRQVRLDFALLTAGRKSEPLPAHCTLIGDASQLYIEPGGTCCCAVLNVTEGPIYIGRDAEVMEGCCLRGPVALCEHAVFKMGAKVYGATTIGPYCKVGGEIGNVIMTGYSNKAHDGYLGNAVIGEWCNLGAGCVSSNLKNDYSLIRLWSYADKRFARTDMQFCGLIMGDHSKAGIQTMFNTATTVGVGCNIHGAGFPRTFIPSYSFGGAAGFERQRFDKFISTARTVMARRHIELTEADEKILTYLYSLDDYGEETVAE